MVFPRLGKQLEHLEGISPVQRVCKGGEGGPHLGVRPVSLAICDGLPAAGPEALERSIRSGASVVVQPMFLYALYEST